MHAIVVGAGIAGLTVADVLGRGGWDVTVLEQAPAPREQGYMLDFFGPGFDAAQATGLLPGLRRRAYDIREVTWVDPRGRTRASLDYGALRDAVDGRFLSLMRPDVEAAVREHLPGAVDVRYGNRVTGVEDGDDGVTARVEGHPDLHADVLAGADGIHSRVRGHLLGAEPADQLHHLGYHTCAYTVEDEALHARWEHRFAMTDTVQRSVGIYGPRGGRVAMFGVHRTNDTARPADARADILERYAGLAPFVDDVLERCPPADEIYYDVVAQVLSPRWTSGRVVLVGDAAHAVSLLAGQGASLAVAGGALLGRRLLDAGAADGREVGRHELTAAIRAYEDELRPAVEQRQEAGRRAAGSFVPRDRLGLWARRLALRAMRVPGLRSLVVGRLVGKQAEVFRV